MIPFAYHYATSPQEALDRLAGDSGAALLAGGRRSLHRKVRESGSYQFALVSCSLTLDVEQGIVRAARIALGGLGTKQWRTREAAFLGRFADARAFGDAATLAMRGARPRTGNTFKVGMAEQVLTRSLLDVAEMTS